MTERNIMPSFDRNSTETNARVHVRTNGTTTTHPQQPFPVDLDVGPLSPRSKELDAPAPKSYPELEPDIRGLVPLKEVVDRMVHQAFADLQNLTEILPASGDGERKRAILEYCASTRKQFIKLLVLVKWAGNSEEIQRCQNIIAFLQKQNDRINRSVSGLYDTRVGLASARIRNFDVLTAIDVLTTGTYCRLPEIIRSQYIPPPPLTSSEVKQTLAELDNVIRMRLLMEEVVPAQMRPYKIANGRVYFHVENEFKVSLTLPGPEPTAQWRILSLDILVRSSGENFGDIATNLTKPQLDRLYNEAWKQLIRPPNPATSSNSEQLILPTAQSTFFPLVKLYDCLHTFALIYQLEILHLQASYLAGTRWADQLTVEMDPSRTSLRLGYWSKATPAMSSIWKSEPSNKISQRTSTNATVNAMNFLVITVEESPNDQASLVLPVPSPRSISSSSNDEQAGRVPSQARIFVKWSGMEMDTTRPVDGAVCRSDGRPCVRDLPEYEINPADLNAERLLLHAVEYHARTVVLRFRDALLSKEMQVLTPFTDEDVRLVKEGGEGAASTVQNAADATSELATPSAQSATVSHSPLSLGSYALYFRFRHERSLRLAVDARIGRVTLSEPGRASSNTDIKLRSVEDRLNEYPADATGILLSLLYMTIIDEVESVATHVGFSSYRWFPLRTGELEKLSTNAKNFLFLQFPPNPDYFLVLGIAEGKFLFWLVRVEIPDHPPSAGFRAVYPLRTDGFFAYRGRGDMDVRKRSRGTVGGNEGPSRRKRFKRDGEVRDTSTSEMSDDGAEDEVEERIGSLHELEITIETISVLYRLCRLRISHLQIEAQLREANIPFAPIVTTSKAAEVQISIQDLLPGAYRESEDQTLKESVFGEDAIVRIEPPSAGSGGCKARFHVVLRTDQFPVNEEIDGDGHATIFPPEKALVFTYTNLDGCVLRFRQRLERAAMVILLAHQLLPGKENVSCAQVEKFDLNALRISYGDEKEYYVDVSYDPSSALGRRKRCYKLRFGKKGNIMSDTSGDWTNPHGRLAFFLEDRLNRSGDIQDLLSVMRNTSPFLTELNELESQLSADGGDEKFISVIPRAADHVRFLYSSHVLDIRLSGRFVSISDAASHSIPQHRSTATLPNGIKSERRKHIPIPHFDNIIASIRNDISQRMADSASLAIPSQSRDVSCKLPSSSNVCGDRTQDADVFVPLHRALICCVNQSRPVIRSIVNCLGIVTVFEWLESLIRTMICGNEIVQVDWDQLRISFVTGQLRYSVFAEGFVKWRIDARQKEGTSNAPKSDVLTEAELSGLSSFFASKVMGPVKCKNAFTSIFRLLQLPPAVLKDCVKIMGLPKDGPLSLHWCLTVPEDAPLHIGKVGEPAVVLRAKENIVCILFRLSDANRRVYLPLLYNWLTSSTSIWDVDDRSDDGLHDGTLSTSELLARMKKKNEKLSRPGRILAQLMPPSNLNCKLFWSVRQLLQRSLSDLEL